MNPDAEEVFYDDVDDNCNPADDYDADGDGYPSAGYGGAGGMQGGTFVIIDCDDYDPTVSPGVEETYYDGIDSDCSGDSTDFDADGDGFDAAVYGGDDCDDSRDDVYPESPFEKWYDGIDSDCLGNNDYDQDEDGYSAEIGGGEDCDDLDPDIHPDAVDVLGDGIDMNSMMMVMVLTVSKVVVVIAMMKILKSIQMQRRLFMMGWIRIVMG